MDGTTKHHKRPSSSSTHGESSITSSIITICVSTENLVGWFRSHSYGETYSMNQSNRNNPNPHIPTTGFEREIQHVIPCHCTNNPPPSIFRMLSRLGGPIHSFSQQHTTILSCLFVFTLLIKSRKA